jgi:hypothetical protein
MRPRPVLARGCGRPARLSEPVDPGAPPVPRGAGDGGYLLAPAELAALSPDDDRVEDVPFDPVVPDAPEPAFDEPAPDEPVPDEPEPDPLPEESEEGLSFEPEASPADEESVPEDDDEPPPLPDEARESLR